MLPKKNRLTKRKDFEDVHHYGKFFYFRNIAIGVLKNELHQPRIGFSVGMNFSKKAIDRNRIKRQLRNIFYKYIKKIKKNVDVVVIVKKTEKGKIGWNDLNLSIENMLRRARLIDNDKKWE